MPSSQALRTIVQQNLTDIVVTLNQALIGQNLYQIQSVLQRLGRDQQLPHWFEELQRSQTLPNLDGKTIGSVIEMLFVAILETFFFQHLNLPPLRINPAKGVDLPDLELGIKSPSTNYATSEPFFSAYERLLGNEYDCVVLLTDYQEKKRNPPLTLQIIDAKYLVGSQISDYTLCEIALKQRDWLLQEDVNWARKVFKFLAYVNQQDWRARHLLKLVNVLQEPDRIRELIEVAKQDYTAKNKKYTQQDKLLIPRHEVESLIRISQTTPLSLGVIFAADSWVEETHKDFSRSPNENEWNRLLRSPLDGQIGMSFALQWRYNFSRVFHVAKGRANEAK